MVHLVRLGGGGGFAGADGPNRLVGQDDAPQLLLGDAPQGRLGLHSHNLLGDAGLPLLQQLADAEDHLQPGVQGGADPLLDGDVGLPKILAALRMADDHVLHPQLLEHRGGNLPGEGAGFRPVAVFRAHRDVGAGGGRQGGFQVGVGDADNHAAVRVLHQGQQLLDEGLGLGTGLVHLPVSGDDRFAQVLVHSVRSFSVVR